MYYTSVAYVLARMSVLDDLDMLLQGVVMLGVVAFIVLLVKRRTASDYSLILQRFEISNAPGRPLIDIIGRQEGLLAWFLGLLKLDADFAFRVYPDRMQYSASSLYGSMTATTPIDHVSVINGGYYRPFNCILGAVFAFLIGCMLSIIADTIVFFIVGVLVAGVFAILYALNKRMGMRVEVGGTAFINIYMKRGVMDHVPVDIEHVRRAVQLMADVACRRGPSAPPQRPQAPSRPRPH